MPLAVLAANKLDKITLISGTALSLAYVPGRAIDIGSALDFTATRMRDTVPPIVQMAMVLAAILWWRQPDCPGELVPFKKPKVPQAEASPTVSGATPPKAASSRSSPSKVARSQAPIPVKELAPRRRS